MGRTKRLVIEWDGEHLPEALKNAAPGRYALEALADVPLSDDEDAGLRAALDQLDAGQGRSLAEVIQEIRSGYTRR